MKVSGIGEFGLIETLARLIAAENKTGEAWRNLITGIGDDAAVWRSGPGIQMATVDALVQDVHFNLALTSWEHLGWKALAVNLSDIAAMGGDPRYALVSLTLPGDTEVADVLSLYRGMLDLAAQSGVAIVGGNISSSPLVVISITLLGEAPGSPPQWLSRSSAQAGDRVAVTGRLGTAAAGLRALSGSLRVDGETMAELEAAFLRPSPRLAEGRLLARCGVKTAIDVSDGLVSDLGHICQASHLGARVNTRTIPVAPAVTKACGAESLELALAGGEDYELLFTAPAPVIEMVEASGLPKMCPITVIGEMVDQSEHRVVLLDEHGTELHTEKLGWEHFVMEKHGH